MHARPESVLVVVHAPGAVLLLERASPAGWQQSVTGTLEWGEMASAAARRELREETGLEASDGEWCDCRRTNVFPILPAWRARYAPGETFNHEQVFALRLPAPAPVRLNPAEHVRYQWLAPEEAMARASSWTNRAAIRHYCQGP
jgi:dATP pyrophosphohydrolase